MLQYGTPTEAVWFEKPWAKNFRRLYAGQSPWRHDPKKHLTAIGLGHLPVNYIKHHQSHAAAGFYTSKFNNASILVVDAIGEWNTVSIWSADESGLKPVWTKNYPHSMGLFYTAFTDYLGLKPNEEEYILMGMAALGQPKLVEVLKEEFFDKFEGPDFKLKVNLHRGCRAWPRPEGVSDYDVASSVQALMEEYLLETVKWMRRKLPSDNLVFMGGVALNLSLIHI